VLPASRRIFLFWLLLLLPALAVGAAAILLLRREQVRITEQSAEAQAVRRANLEARARLTVENIELLVSEAQNGLLDTLAGEPSERIDVFLDRWERENPLVRIAFRTGQDGRLVRPDARATSEEGRGFLRRFARQFGAAPPWSVKSAATTVRLTQASAKPALVEPEARKEISQNVEQVQSARRNLQDLVKAPEYSNAASNSFRQATAPAGSAVAEKSAPLGAVAAAGMATEAKKAEADTARSPDRTGKSDGALAMNSLGLDGQRARPQSPLAVRSKDSAVERRAWLPVNLEGRLHLVGWVQGENQSEVRGLELNLAALVARLNSTLPSGVGGAEGYALFDDQGRVQHQVGAVSPGATPAVRVPLAAGLLPGWQIAGFLRDTGLRGGSGDGFFLVGTVLVGIFVVAILSGGALLLRQARLSAAEAAQKTSFVANVSHEFKTPLTTIRLYAELLEQGRVRDATQGGDYLRTIGRETQRLARLVNNALDFSRLEQGQKKFAREAFDLTRELTRLLDTHEPRVAEAGLALRRELPPQPMSVTTDRDALEQIVINLLDNACKYAAEGGEISVVARAAGLGVELCVADRGPGVPAEHRERIFDKFHRVDDTLTAEKSGAGLGLSIARQLARGLGGDLRYAPRAGGGAEFILTLP
jgi:two-component system phosphate regulon sensor histidine kinase PhoR